MTKRTDAFFQITSDPGEPFPDEEIERFLEEIYASDCSPCCLDDPDWVEREQQKSSRILEKYGFYL